MKILILPFSRHRQPYQKISILYFVNLGYEVEHGCHFSIFPVSRNVISSKPNIVFIDWIHQWYLKKNALISWCLAFFLIMDLFYTRFLLRKKIIFNVHNLQHHSYSGQGLLQKLAIFAFFRLSHITRFFSFGQRRKFCEVFRIKEAHPALIVARELSPLDYYEALGQKNELSSGNKLAVSKPARDIDILVLGEARVDKRYIEFFLENESRFAGLLVVATDPDVFYRLSTFSRLSVEHRSASDPSLVGLLRSSRCLLLPYDATTFNSGMANLASFLGLDILCTFEFGVLQDLSPKLRSEWRIGEDQLWLFGAKMKAEPVDWRQVFRLLART